MKGRAEESSIWNLKQGRKKKMMNNRYRLTLSSASFYMYTLWLVPHLHKSLGLHLHEGKKNKKTCAAASREHKA